MRRLRRHVISSNNMANTRTCEAEAKIALHACKALKMVCGNIQWKSTQLLLRQYTVELGYNVMRGTEYIVSL
jgi:hypothetical protein